MKKAAWILAILVCLAGGYIVINTTVTMYYTNKPEVLISTFLLVIALVLVVYVFARAVDRILEK